MKYRHTERNVTLVDRAIHHAREFSARCSRSQAREISPQEKNPKILRSQRFPRIFPHFFRACQHININIPNGKARVCEKLSCRRKNDISISTIARAISDTFFRNIYHLFYYFEYFCDDFIIIIMPAMKVHNFI